MMKMLKLLKCGDEAVQLSSYMINLLCHLLELHIA